MSMSFLTWLDTVSDREVLPRMVLVSRAGGPIKWDMLGMSFGCFSEHFIHERALLGGSRVMAMWENDTESHRLNKRRVAGIWARVAKRA